MSNPLVGNAATTCNESPIYLTYKNDKPDAIKIIQQRLILIGNEALQTDGQIGRDTLGALVRFCEDVAIEGDNDPISSVDLHLREYAAIAEKNPGWKEVIKNDDFIQWLNKQSNAVQEHYKSISLEGTVLPITILSDYIFDHDNTQESYYFFTENDIEKLKKGNDVIDQLTSMVDVKYESKTEIITAVSAIIKEVTDQYKKYIPIIIQSVLASDAADSSDDASQDTTVYSVTEDSLQKLIVYPDFQEIPQSLLETVAQLQDSVFIQVDLFRIALTLTLDTSNESVNPRLLDWIISKAKKQGTPEDIIVKKIEWQGSECGCSHVASTDDRYPSYIYGIYPFWMAGDQSSITKDEPELGIQDINFSVLSRIGYFALSIDNNYSIINPRHWQKQRYFSEFIDKARQYKTKVDLVIYDSDWKKWITATPENRDRLTSEIDDLVKMTLTNYPINVIKPYISFGQSPTRSLGDGVTVNFDFDFEGISDSKQQEVFDRINQSMIRLKEKLVGATKSADVSDNYFLNIMWPIDGIINNTGFYKMDNLVAMSNHVNLFLVAIDVATDSMEKLKTLRKRIDNIKDNEKKDDIEMSEVILKKLLPLIKPAMYTDDEIDNAFRYTDWNYSGVALWPMPLASNVNKSVKSTFISTESVSENTVSINANKICNVMCPHRWVARITLFLLAFVIFSYAILSIQFCALRTVLGKSYFLIFIFFAVIFLMLTFLCDPYWKQQQSKILFISIAIGVISIIWLTLKKRREAEYP